MAKNHVRLGKKVLEGLKLSYQRLIEFKKQKGTPLIVGRDGKTVYLNP